MTNTSNPHLGSTLDDLLEADGTLAQAEAVAVKRVLAWQIGQTIAAEHLNKAEMARRMKTSRAALDRLLDPDNPSVTLLTLQKAATALDKRLKIELVDSGAFSRFPARCAFWAQRPRRRLALQAGRLPGPQEVALLPRAQHPGPTAPTRGSAALHRYGTADCGNSVINGMTFRTPKSLPQAKTRKKRLSRKRYLVSWPKPTYPP